MGYKDALRRRKKCAKVRVLHIALITGRGPLRLHEPRSNSGLIWLGVIDHRRRVDEL